MSVEEVFRPIRDFFLPETPDIEIDVPEVEEPPPVPPPVEAPPPAPTEEDIGERQRQRQAESARRFTIASTRIRPLGLGGFGQSRLGQ